MRMFDMSIFAVWERVGLGELMNGIVTKITTEGNNLSRRSTFIEQASGAQSAPNPPMPVSIIDGVQCELVRDFARLQELSAQGDRLYGLSG